MKKIVSLLMIVVLSISMTACNKGANAVDIVKNGELSAYPGKPIAETFDKVVGAKNNNYKAEWSDITDSELGKTMAESMKEEGYTHAVSFVMKTNSEQLTLIWWVNTENGKFDLFSANDGNKLYSASDSMVTNFFDSVFK